MESRVVRVDSLPGSTGGGNGGRVSFGGSGWTPAIDSTPPSAPISSGTCVDSRTGWEEESLGEEVERECVREGQPAKGVMPAVSCVTTGRLLLP